MLKVPQTKANLIKDNKAEICKLLMKAAGTPPKAPLYSLHRVCAKRICTSCEDPYLTNAGKWGVFCVHCNRFYLSAPAVNIPDLLTHNEAFQSLLAMRWALLPKSRQLPSLKQLINSLSANECVRTGSVSATIAQVALPLPRLKTLVIWTIESKPPVLIGIFHTPSELLLLSKHKLALGKQGIEYNTELEQFDFSTKAWVKAWWSEGIVCPEERDNVLIKYSGLTRLWKLSSFII